MAWDDYRQYIDKEVAVLNNKPRVTVKKKFSGCPHCGFNCNHFGKGKPECDNCNWCLTESPDLFNSKFDKTYDRNNTVVHA